MTRIRILAVTTLLLLASEAFAQGEPDEARVLRVAFTNWSNWSEVRERADRDNEIRFFETYLGKLQEASGKAGGLTKPVRFQMGLGNYYQVLAWMRSGQVDAAVATPLVAALLERDGVTISSFELAGGNDGYFPVIAVRGASTDDPLMAYEAYLKQLLEVTRSPSPDTGKLADLQKDYRIHFVSHLSASGFAIPLMYAQQWLAGEDQVPSDVENRFWKALTEGAYFELFHSSGSAGSAGSGADIYFSYCAVLDRCASSLAWRPYEVDMGHDSGAANVIERAVPNDVFVIRKDVASAIQWPTSKFAVESQLVRPAAGISNRYNVQPVRPIVQSKFRERVLAMFFPIDAGDRYLPSAANQWFEAGRFAFTLEETLNFLRQDQRNSQVPQLSLVLSGGGVKSLYQAELLNHLYALEGSRPELENFIPNKRRSDRKTDQDPLIVHSIIGTSGGAILAFFAAQLPSLPDKETLTGLMSRMAAKDVFPYFGLPRVVSVLVLLTIFLAVILLARAFSKRYRRLSKSVRKKGPIYIFHVCVLVFVAGVVALRIVRGYNFEYLSVLEGLLFMLTALVLHMVATCAVRVHASRQRVALLEGWGTIALGVALILAAIGVAYTFAETQGYERSEGPAFLSLLVAVGALLVALGIARLAHGGFRGLELRNLGDYFRGLAVLLVFLGTTYLILVVLKAFGGSLLEVTGTFWGALLFFGSVVAAVMLIALRKRRSFPPFQALTGGIIALMRDRVAGITTTMMVTLVLAGVQGVLLWIFLMAPAVYGNSWALQAVRNSMEEKHLGSSGFHANLVVTGALLQKEDCGSPEASLAPGGLYMCFEGNAGCGSAAGRNWRVFRRPNATRAIDAVFASGSPFPMFPRHLAHTPDGCAIRLIDGGYAHNVPLDAARSLGGRQVLIVNASPEDLSEEVETISMTGQLVRESPRLLSFMFDRAQALDKSAGGTLLVASLGPHFDEGQENSWPFLLDFRPQAQDLVRRQARTDIEGRRRIGRLLNWGLPVFIEIQP